MFGFFLFPRFFRRAAIFAAFVGAATPGLTTESASFFSDAPSSVASSSDETRGVETNVQKNLETNVETELRERFWFDDGVFPKRFKSFRRFSWSGWASVGATSNATFPAPSTSGYMAASRKSGAFCGPNQIAGTFERKIDETAARWDFGGRVDWLFGADYLSTSSIGLETRTFDAVGRPTSNVSAAVPRWNVGKNGSRPTSGLALPQLYAELSAPIAAGLSIKSGHWYFPVGFESVAAPQNFFYSRSYTATYGNPQTATGLLATLRADRNFSVFAGFSEPWNVWESSSAAVADGLTFVGGFERTWGRKNADGDAVNSLALAGSRGDETTSRRGETGLLCGVWRQEISKKARFVFVAEIGRASNGGFKRDSEGNALNVDGSWGAVVGYLFVETAENFELGGRAEYFRDGNRSRISLPGNLASNGEFVGGSNATWRGADYWEGTFGGRWTPKKWLIVRPEIRWDVSNVAAKRGGKSVASGVYDDFTRKNSLTVGGDVVVLF